MIWRALYRAGQFFDALLARVSQDELRQANMYLPPQAQCLFRAMPPADQRHGLAVMRSLARAGHTHPALLAAALLHDVGKRVAWLTPIHRTLIVLLEWRWPAGLAWLSREEKNGQPAPAWRRPFIVQRCHPELGAQQASQAGCDELSVTLIRRHHAAPIRSPQSESERLLAELQQADKNC